MSSSSRLQASVSLFGGDTGGRRKSSVDTAAKQGCRKSRRLRRAGLAKSGSGSLLLLDDWLPSSAVSDSPRNTILFLISPYRSLFFAIHKLPSHSSVADVLPKLSMLSCSKACGPA